MGITAARPYIIDEFESEDEAIYDLAEEWVTEPVSSPPACPVAEINGPLSTEQQTEIQPVVDTQTQEVQVSTSVSLSSLRGLEELLKLLENHDFNGAQKAASLLKKSPAFCVSRSASTDPGGDDPASLQPLEKSLISSTLTSTWSTNTEEDVTETTSCSFPLLSEPAEDLTEDQRRVLAQLDEELDQFEANEKKIVGEAQVFHSNIPRLIPGGLGSSASTGTVTNTSKKNPERKRSPSPSGKTSGIPRYSWAHVASLNGSPTSPVESKTEHAFDASCLSDTLESLPELSDRIQTIAGRKSWEKTFGTDRSTSSTVMCSECSRSSGQSGDAPSLSLNICDHTGRVRVKKRHSGIPSNWTRQDGQHQVSKSDTINSTSVSSDKATEEMGACTAVGECGDLSERKVFDLRRWYCMSRPQYRSSCGISAVVSCWNYLFSTMGRGRLKPVSQETAMKLLGFTPPFDEISFGPVTGNLTLLRWFNELCSHFKVRGQGWILYKPCGKNQTEGVTADTALTLLKAGLKDMNTAFVYHCHNHYFCPIGYEDTPQFCVDAYRADVGSSVESWVLIGETSRKYPTIHCISWEQICQDLNCRNPSYVNIRQSWKGVMQQKNLNAVGENLHCILALQRVPEDSHLSSNMYTTTKSAFRSLHPPSSPSLLDAQASLRSTVSAHRPEVGNDFLAGYEEEEVGFENLDSDKIDDDNDVDESGNTLQENET